MEKGVGEKTSDYSAFPIDSSRFYILKKKSKETWIKSLYKKFKTDTKIKKVKWYFFVFIYYFLKFQKFLNLFESIELFEIF